jgi:hypothetical protein
MGGPIEEGAKVASAAVDALRTTPVFIALLLLQGLTLGGITFSIHERAKYANEERANFSAERKLFYEICAGDRQQQVPK